MTRGRSKDLTIPTSRALTQQRDYRARKAKHLADLEERCRRAEVENAKLRKELELARAGLLAREVSVSSETAQVALELMQHLNAASASLSRFQQLTFTHNQPLPPPPAPSQTHHPTTTTTPFPSPAALSPFPQTTVSSFHQPNPQTDIFLKPIDASGKRGGSAVNPTRRTSPGGSIDSDEECCGGFIDCRHLVEEVPERDREDVSFNPLVKNSNMRSTSHGVPAL